jgi:hypothetical protein
MKRSRFRIAGLMAVVGAVAINLVVMRSFDESKSDSLPHLFFACGVMPMASLLILVALTSAPSLMRGGRLSPFVLGFEATGLLVVFAFVTCYSLAPSILLDCIERIGVYTRPVFNRYFTDPSRGVALALELGFGTVIFSLPQCLVALLGGWVNHVVGFTVRFERPRRELAVPVSGSTSEATGLTHRR